MKTSSVYYKAAELIASKKEDFCCNALMNPNLFQELFRPNMEENIRHNRVYYQSAWFGNHLEEKNQLARTLALLLMAEMESRGEL